MRKYYIFKELYNGSFLPPVAQAMPIKNYKINNLTIKVCTPRLFLGFYRRNNVPININVVAF